jgi:hypothetical protein
MAAATMTGRRDDEGAGVGSPTVDAPGGLPDPGVSAGSGVIGTEAMVGVSDGVRVTFEGGRPNEGELSSISCWR